MLSVIIADDEQEVIHLCRMLIEYPVNIIAEAHDGVELLNLIEKLQPDLVITDICMPGINGIELIRKVKSTHPNIHFIIMSGYTEFEYIHQALRLGVWDYLLKPIQKAELNNLLKKLDDYVNTNDRIKENLKKSIEILRENYLHSILMQASNVAIPEVDGEPVLSLDGRPAQFMIFMVENQFSAFDEKNWSSEHHSELFLEQIKQYGIQESEEFVSLREQECYYYLLVYRENYTDEENKAFVKKIFSEMRFYNDQNRFVSFSCGVSRLKTGETASLPELLRQARTALSWKVEEYDDLLHIYSVKKEKFSEKEAVHINEDLLKNALQSMDETCLMDAADKIWDENYTGRPGEGMALLEAFGIVCEHIWNQMDLAFDRRSFCGNIYSCTKSPKQLRQNIRKALTVLLKEYKEAMTTKESSTVLKAKQYVEKNYGEQVTLNDIAKYVCLSPAYFSAIFKTETGMGFVKYLQHVRIEKAKVLLRESHMSIEAIARQVGYNDIRYFKQLFKNETNVTPKEYRKFYS